MAAGTWGWRILMHDPKLAGLFFGVLMLLIVASAIGAVSGSRTAKSDAARATIDNLNARTRAWWKMCAVFALTLLMGRIGSLALFALLSLLALREYITLMPTRRGDHRTLVWMFFFITPLQYYLIGVHWYGFFSVMIPDAVGIFCLFPRVLRFRATRIASWSAPRRFSSG